MDSRDIMNTASSSTFNSYLFLFSYSFKDGNFVFKVTFVFKLLLFFYIIIVYLDGGTLENQHSCWRAPLLKEFENQIKIKKNQIGHIVSQLDTVFMISFFIEWENSSVFVNNILNETLPFCDRIWHWVGSFFARQIVCKLTVNKRLGMTDFHIISLTWAWFIAIAISFPTRKPD